MENACFPISQLNHLPLLEDGFQSWSSLLNDKFWSLDIGDNFAIEVASVCVEGIANWDTA